MLSHGEGWQRRGIQEHVLMRVLSLRCGMHICVVSMHAHRAEEAKFMQLLRLPSGASIDSVLSLLSSSAQIASI